MTKMGRLFYIIGASGSGKDSLLRYAREHLQTRYKTLFAHRYITRPIDSENENHIALTGEEYDLRLQNQCFAMDWRSHSLKYAIGIEIESWLKSGLNVVVNGSREYLPVAAEKYQMLVPILICVSPDILEQRLKFRAREDEEEINRRILRSKQITLVEHPRLMTLNNDGLLEEAGQKLIQILGDSDKNSDNDRNLP